MIQLISLGNIFMSIMRRISIHMCGGIEFQIKKIISIKTTVNINSAFDDLKNTLKSLRQKFMNQLREKSLVGLIKITSNGGFSRSTETLDIN